MAFGTESALRICRQDSAGTPGAQTTSFHSVPFISETLVTNVPNLFSDTIRARYEQGPSAPGIINAAGDIVMRMHPDTVGVFAYAWTGAASSTQINSCYSHVFVPRQTTFHADMSLPPWTVEKYPGTDEAHFYHDGQCNRLTIEVAGAQYARMTANMMFRTHSTATKSTPSFPAGVEYTWNQASLSLAGAANVLWENVTLTFDNALEYFSALDGTTVYRRVLRNNYRTVRVTGLADFPDNNQFDIFRAGSEQPFDLTMKGLTISSGNIETFRIQIPTLRYTAYPVQISGPNRLTVGFEAIGIYNTGSALICQMSVVNTRAAY